MRFGQLSYKQRIGATIICLTLAAACKHDDGDGKDGKGKGGDKPVPVQAVVAEKRAVPIYLDGIGSAEALYTVTLHTRVDGELITVGFKEGEKVKKGDLIAQIDPRPFNIQLQTAAAQLAKDQAGLKDIQLNLDRDKSAARAKSHSTANRR